MFALVAQIVIELLSIILDYIVFFSEQYFSLIDSKISLMRLSYVFV